MTAKQCTKKRDASAKLLFCQSKPIAFLPFSLTSPSSLLLSNQHGDRSEKLTYKVKYNEKSKNCAKLIQHEQYFGWPDQPSSSESLLIKCICVENFFFFLSVTQASRKKKSEYSQTSRQTCELLWPSAYLSRYSLYKCFCVLTNFFILIILTRPSFQTQENFP